MHIRSQLPIGATWIVILAGWLFACTASSDAVDELYLHTEAITSLLEKHRAEPAAAIAAIEAYEDKHGEAITRLIRKSREIRADLGQRSKRQLRARWETQSVELRKRLEKLTERRSR